jgi:DnaJ-class molecular chaperone
MGATPYIEPLSNTVASLLAARNYFEVIGLEPSRCCGTELKSAYKKTALKVLTDKCEDSRAIEAFRRLQEAFKVLSDPMLHARYTQHLASAETRAAAGRAHARSAAYAQRAKMSKDELERQVREMMARQSKQHPMASS